jgi:hypothetical protein
VIPFWSRWRAERRRIKERLLRLALVHATSQDEAGNVTVPLVYNLTGKVHRWNQPCSMCGAAGDLGLAENREIVGKITCLVCVGSGSIEQGCGGAVETDLLGVTRRCIECGDWLGPERVSAAL